MGQSQSISGGGQRPLRRRSFSEGMIQESQLRSSSLMVQQNGASRSDDGMPISTETAATSSRGRPGLGSFRTRSMRIFDRPSSTSLHVSSGTGATTTTTPAITVTRSDDGDERVRQTSRLSAQQESSSLSTEATTTAAAGGGGGGTPPRPSHRPGLGSFRALSWRASSHRTSSTGPTAETTAATSRSDDGDERGGRQSSSSVSTTEASRSAATSTLAAAPVPPRPSRSGMGSFRTRSLRALNRTASTGTMETAAASRSDDGDERVSTTTEARSAATPPRPSRPGMGSFRARSLRALNRTASTGTAETATSRSDDGDERPAATLAAPTPPRPARPGMGAFRTRSMRALNRTSSTGTAETAATRSDDGDERVRQPSSVFTTEATSAATPPRPSRPGMGSFRTRSMRTLNRPSSTSNGTPAIGRSLSDDGDDRRLTARSLAQGSSTFSVDDATGTATVTAASATPPPRPRPGLGSFRPRSMRTFDRDTSTGTTATETSASRSDDGDERRRGARSPAAPATAGSSSTAATPPRPRPGLGSFRALSMRTFDRPSSTSLMVSDQNENGNSSSTSHRRNSTDEVEPSQRTSTPTPPPPSEERSSRRGGLSRLRGLSARSLLTGTRSSARQIGAAVAAAEQEQEEIERQQQQQNHDSDPPSLVPMDEPPTLSPANSADLSTDSTRSTGGGEVIPPVITSPSRRHTSMEPQLAPTAEESMPTSPVPSVSRVAAAAMAMSSPSRITPGRTVSSSSYISALSGTSRSSTYSTPSRSVGHGAAVDLQAAAARMMPNANVPTTSTSTPLSSTAATAGNHNNRLNSMSSTTSSTTGPVVSYRRTSMESLVSDMDVEEQEMSYQQHLSELEFFPPISRDNEWMGRSIESLLLGHLAPAPILALMEGDGSFGDASCMLYDSFSSSIGGANGALDYYEFMRRRSTASTFGGKAMTRRRSSQGSFAGGRRSSLSLSGNVHGGTLANYYNNRRRQVPTDVDRTVPNDRLGSMSSVGSLSRRGSTHTGYSNGPMYRRRNSSMASGSIRGSMSQVSASEYSRGGGNNISSTDNGASNGSVLGPNVLFSVMARESTGKSCFARNIPHTQCLHSMGGSTLLAVLDKPAAGMATEVAFLAAAIHTGDWTETQTIVSRLAPRLIGDPMMNNAANTAMPQGQHGANGNNPSNPRRTAVEDANLPPTAPRFYAGGGRLGLERDAFILAGGIEVLIRMFREKSFVGQEMAFSYDARDLSEEIVATRLAHCWNETLASLRELVYAIPTVVQDGTVLDNGSFLPFLFTLLSHDSCFDGAAALIEEILSLLSQSPQQLAPQQDEGGDGGVHASASGDTADAAPYYQPAGRASPATTFFLGNVPDLYKLWNGFTCRQLAHFCRILALLVFEPEDRQLLESPAVLKSLELLQLRRNRAVRAGRDSTVDMNQAILLGDEELTTRLLQLLRVMNYAPSIRRFSPYHVLAHYPFIPDTLIMLGLSELDNWEEVDRQDELARELLTTPPPSNNNRASPPNGIGNNNPPETATEPPLLSELGAVADLLEGLSDSLSGHARDQVNQLGLIIRVVSAAQQAGVIVGRNNSRREQNIRDQEAAAGGLGGVAVAAAVDDQFIDLSPGAGGVPVNAADFPVDGATVQGLASVAGILTDQVLVRRLFQSGGQGLGDPNPNATSPFRGENTSNSSGPPEERGAPLHFINTPEDAANSLQFNAMLLGPYQVEVLFVLCTLLGGRRKLDAQDTLNNLGMIPVLDDMFQRLPWHERNSTGSTNENVAEPPREEVGGGGPAAEGDPQQPNGIHGPGCECTPESALCVQYLRLLHNFCDRDCDNYSGRRLLLSESERRVIFCDNANTRPESVQPGLLSKIISAFINESDESPYRFWLASCIESYLRGSSAGEQVFAARSGLLEHLIEDVSSERLHCAGSLQTSFDLLGELGKGNAEVFTLLASSLDEESFRKLMSVAAANLVDSNVFIRSLLLSLERLSASDQLVPLYLDPSIVGTGLRPWSSQTGNTSRSYLTHSWWDSRPIPLVGSRCSGENGSDESLDEGRQSDWFPSRDILEANGVPGYDAPGLPSGLDESVGYFGWLFAPAGASLSGATYLPNSVERLSWFLAANQARLLRDLLGVVDLRNINHENICCLNTAVVIAIFAHRRQQLATLLEELRQMNDEEKESKRRALGAANSDDVVDRAFLQAMRYMDLGQQQERPPYARISSIASTSTQQIGDRTDVMRNFREVLWFWTEYYTHRGRDRLSLEFSSHIRFQEWNHVVSLLAADDGSATALVRSPVRLPRSPYQRSARIAENPLRGV